MKIMMLVTLLAISSRLAWAEGQRKGMDPEVKVILEPFRQKILQDTRALKQERAGKDQGRIGAARAQLKADLKAFQKKRLELAREKRDKG